MLTILIHLLSSDEIRGISYLINVILLPWYHKKYSKLRCGPSRLTAYIKNIITKLPEKSLIEKHLFAEHLIKSCLQYRESYKSDFVKNLHVSVPLY